MKQQMFIAAIALPLAAAMLLGIYWALWTIWCWVLPQLWPAGPRALIAPGYWLFAGAWFLAHMLGRGIFGRRAKP
ncbi:MAG TPA: hypothetical protein VFM56_12700 [Solimonas sp.]|nr:hypothetical protein [Solimonas sp.]